MEKQDQNETNKTPYQTPEIAEHGTIEAQTQGGAGQDTDAQGGSVLPG